MARFSEQFIQQVAQATDIVDLVGRYVALKRVGKEFASLCPFHDDHHPSMSISPAKQIFYCFVCHAGGGAIKFVEMYEKISFPDAVRLLAERANIPLPQDNGPPERTDGLGKNDLQKVMAFAATFYKGQLATAAGRAAKDYALKRGLTEESLERFGLGYAPAAWDALVQAARRQRIGEDVLLTAGLAAKRESGGCYDRFRNRLMFPIYDADGKVIAFGGRALDPEERAKYLNSPQSPLFDKSGCLYGLNWSRQGIVASGQAIIVEGYMDAVMPLQCGVNNIVATLGTALTDRHVRLISRYAKQVVLLFDADAAGIAASERAMEVFVAQQLHVKITSVPSGKDPCDFALAEGGPALVALANSAPDALGFIWDRRQKAWQEAGGDLADRHRLVEDFLRLVACSAAYGAIDEVRRGQLAQHIGHMLNIPASSLQQQMRALARQVNRPAPAANIPQASGTSGGDAITAMAERQMVEVLLCRPELFDSILEKVDAADFTDPTLRHIAQAIWELGQEGRFTLESLLTREDLSPLGSLIGEMAMAGEHRGNFESTLTGAADHIAARRQSRQVETLKGDLSSEDSLREYQKNLGKRDVRRYMKIE